MVVNFGKKTVTIDITYQLIVIRNGETERKISSDLLLRQPSVVFKEVLGLLTG